MSTRNLDDLDDEELLSLFDSTKKLLEAGKEKEESSIRKKIASIQQRLTTIEQEMRMRSLWDGD